MAKSLTIEVPNRRDAIEAASRQAAEWLAQFAPSRETVYFVHLAIEELILNCIEHGYVDTERHVVQVRLSVEDGCLDLTFVDDGRAFDPVAQAPPDLSIAIEDRPIGGLGIHMLRTLADSMHYERVREMNRLLLRKRLL